jgi:hypothetical protein
MGPETKRTYGGSLKGTGAFYAWAGNDNVGEGRMLIVKSERPSKVSIKLELIKPWAAINVATFAFAPATAGTNVTWTMDGRNSFMAKGVSLVTDVDMGKMLDGDFERGLAMLKLITERYWTTPVVQGPKVAE